MPELTTGAQSYLAIDGTDELLTVFVAYGVPAWGDYFTAILAASPGRTYTLRTDGAAWRVRTGPGLFTVEDGPGDDGAADVTVSGPPAALLRWAWNQESAGEPAAVLVEGTPEVVGEPPRPLSFVLREIEPFWTITSS